MKISPVSANINFKSQPLSTREQAYRVPGIKTQDEINLIYAQRAAAMNGISINQVAINYSGKYAYNRALDVMNRAKAVEDSVKNIIKKGEESLFSNFKTKDTSVEFYYDEDLKEMVMEEYKDSKLFTRAVFDNSKISSVSRFEDDSNMQIYYDNGEIVKISKNTAYDSKQNAIREFEAKYSDGRPYKVLYDITEDASGEVKKARRVFDFDIFKGRWDYSENYQKVDDELRDDDYIKAKSRYAFDTSKGLIARAEDFSQGFFDSNYGTFAKKIYIFDKGRIVNSAENAVLNKKDWTKVEN